MLGSIIAAIASFISDFISSTGYIGVGALMAFDNANIPIPSEITMSFAGYLVTTARFTYWGAIAAGTIGSIIGSIVSYALGYYGGRPFVIKYGRFVLISKRDLARADQMFAKWGNAIAFFSRLMPILRTFISLPAGITKMSFLQFTVYTAIGSLIWSWLLVQLGVVVGENYETIRDKFHGLDYAVAGLLVVGFVTWVYHFIKEQREISREEKGDKKKKV